MRKRKEGYSAKINKGKGVGTYVFAIFMTIFVGITLAFFASSDFATGFLGISGKVNITAVGRGNTYNEIEDKNGISNMIIYLQDGYSVLIPGMEIDAQVNVKVHRSTTTPLLRAKFTLQLYDELGTILNGERDTSNIAGDLINQLNDIIVNNDDWYLHTDNYYYYIGSNAVNAVASETILAEVNATNSDTIVNFIDSPIKFPNYVTSDYSNFGVKLIVTFQAIQNYIPDDNGDRVPNTINNSLKIFSTFDGQ